MCCAFVCPLNVLRNYFAPRFALLIIQKSSSCLWLSRYLSLSHSLSLLLSLSLRLTVSSKCLWAGIAARRNIFYVLLACLIEICTLCEAHEKWPRSKHDALH